MDWVALLGFALWFPIPFYWYPIHAAVGFWRRQGKRTYWIAAIVWPLSFIGFLAFHRFWMADRFMRNPLTIVLGAVLVLFEFRLTGRAESVLGLARLIGRSEVEPSRFSGALVRTGPYTRVRHPRYVGALSALFGFALLSGSWRVVIAAGASLPLFYLLTVLEERELRLRYGAEFEAYRRAVPRFVPRLFA